MSEVKGVKSRPNSIEFNKEANGNKRNSVEKANKSRPNSMEINGGVNNGQNNKRNSKEIKKSASQDRLKANGGKKQDDAKKDAKDQDKEVPLAEEEDVAQEEPIASPKTEEEPRKGSEDQSSTVEQNRRTPEKETSEVEINKTDATTPPTDQPTDQGNSRGDEKPKEAVDKAEEADSKEGAVEKKSPTEEAGSINEQRESGGSTVTATVSSTNGATTAVPEATDSSATATTAVVVASPPTKTPKYEIIAVRERHGLFRKAVPVMPIVPAVIFCLLNVIAPGIGTLCAGFTVLCGCPTEHDNRPKALLYNVIAAILQLITAPIVVGWVWSIMWGVTFVNVSVTKGVDDTIVTAHV